MALINCKAEHSLTWNDNCILSSKDANSIFTMNHTKLYLPIVTLSADDNVKLSRLLSEGFKRPICWNQYKVIPNKTYDANEYIRELLDSSYQVVKRLFVLAYDDANGITPNSHKKYFFQDLK